MQEHKPQMLTIRWQRLLTEEEQTCERCSSTETELQKAVESLRKSLGELGIEVVLKKETLDSETFARDVSESNRIWINERPLEDWLGAQVGKSECGFCCEDVGDSSVECRTITIGQDSYEAIPAELIIKAGMIAAAELLNPSSREPCCPSSTQDDKGKNRCCPTTEQ